MKLDKDDTIELMPNKGIKKLVLKLASETTPKRKKVSCSYIGNHLVLRTFDGMAEFSFGPLSVPMLENFEPGDIFEIVNVEI